MRTVNYCLVSLDSRVIARLSREYAIGSYAMNPTVAARDLRGSSVGFFKKAQEIRRLIGRDCEFYIQVLGESAREMAADARKIVECVPGNTWVKIPACPEGFRTLRMLKGEGFRLSCTAVLSVNQALLAAACGADIIAVYVSRLDLSGEDGIGMIRKIAQAYRQQGINIPICAASLKNMHQLEQAILAGAECVTVDEGLLLQAARH